MYRVVLVDDEPLIRTGLASFVDWESLNCMILQEIESGQEALDYLLENEVDILICDIKMPHMSGLQLAEALRSQNINVKIIFLTAFSEFSYAQKAIQYQVVDYVVKTNYIEKIPVSVEKAIKEIETERELRATHNEMQNRINNGEKNLREKLILDVINEILTDPQKIEDTAQSSGLDFKWYTLILFNLEQRENLADNAVKFDKTLRKVQDFISLAYQDRKLITVLLSRSAIISLVCVDNMRIEHDCGMITDETNRVAELIEASLGLRLNIGISSPYNGFTELRNAYNEAQAMSMRCLTDKDEAEESHTYTFLVRKVISYIQANYTEKLNVSMIAKQLHVSKSYLGNMYKKEVGESIVDTIAKYRIDKAVELLQDTLMHISEISADVGFDDPAYFTNVFTKYKGISPTAYRNKYPR